MQIKVYHNLDTDFFHPYKVGQTLKMVDWFEVSQLGEVSEESKIEEILERVYRVHNAVDGTERSVEIGVRSLSVGDVVEVDGTRYAVATMGFEPVTEGVGVVDERGRYTIHDYLEDVEDEEENDLPRGNEKTGIS